MGHLADCLMSVSEMRGAEDSTSRGLLVARPNR